MHAYKPKIYYIDLQLFKGNTTVNNQSYQPTQYELQLQKVQADLANQYAPNASWLNDTAKNLLQNSLGAVQVDFNKLNNQAQNQINSANQSNQNLASGIQSQLNDTNKTNQSISSGIQSQLNNANKTNQELINEASSQNNQASQFNQNLMNGVLPQTFVDNMTNAIQSSVKNSYGNLLNNSASSGVLKYLIFQV